MNDLTIRILVAMAAITIQSAMLWSLAFFAGKDGTITAGIGGMAVLIAGLGGYVAIKSSIMKPEVKM